MTSNVTIARRSYSPPPSFAYSALASSSSPPEGPTEKDESFLDSLRRKTQKKWNGQAFDSELFRSAVVQAAKSRLGYAPYSWQTDICEAAYLGGDVLVSAGTGFGKTLPFVLSHFVVPNSVTVIVSPLTALENDQVSILSSIFVYDRDLTIVQGPTLSRDGSESVRCESEHDKAEENAPGEFDYPKLLLLDSGVGLTVIRSMQNIKKGKYEVILTSPEMLLQNDKFLRDLKEMGHLISKFVVDEAHVIKEWAAKFRRAYGDLGDLRAIVKAPIIAASATLPAETLTVVTRTLLYHETNFFLVNLGNRRKNIALTFGPKRSTKKNPLADFEHIITEGENGRFKRRLIFVDSCAETGRLARKLRRAMPASMKDQIGAYHAQRGPMSKQLTMKKFEEHKIMVLVTTEAAGMVSRPLLLKSFVHSRRMSPQGCDFSDIEEVIHYGAPKSITTLVQRIGRAGRDPTISAKAIILYPANAFRLFSLTSKSKTSAAASDARTAGGTEEDVPQTSIKGKGKASKKQSPPELAPGQINPPAGWKWGATLDIDVRKLYVWLECRQEFLDVYFNNPEYQVDSARTFCRRFSYECA